MMILMYNILLYTYFILLFPFYLIKFLTSEKYRIGLKERLGFVRRPKNSKTILIHTVSVGEFLGSVPLMEKLKNNFPEHEIVISTTTLAANRVAKKKVGDRFLVVYFPLDFLWAVKRFLGRISPSLIILVETELWPNFLVRAKDRDIPVVIVNGRISEHSYGNYKRFKAVFRKICGSIKMWGVQFERDKNRLIDLGVRPENIFITGSMKFDSAVLSAKNMSQIFNLKPGTLILMGGSTHRGEEKILIDIYKDIKMSFKNLVLILAPRHIERTEEIAAIAKQCGLRFIKRSACSQAVNISDWDMVLIDTIGELNSIYNLAMVVFIGKSLVNPAHSSGIMSSFFRMGGVKGGGQNLLEPAGLGKAVICGPMMSNFLDITLWLKENRGIIQVNNISELKSSIISLLIDPEKCGNLGKRAKELILKGSGAVDRNIELVQQVMRCQGRVV